MYDNTHPADDPALPPHEHHVRLGLTHTEITAAYGLREKLQLSLRFPYDVKATRVHYTLLDGTPYTPPYGDIHHRTETLRGISDPSLALETAVTPDWIAGLGLSLPAGRTEEDPIRLGTLGLRHEHIQFGSGTFRPILIAQWRRVARVEATLSLYENDRGFRAPTEVAWSAGPTYRVGRVSIAPRLSGQWESVGRWHGVADEGSGARSAGARLIVSMPWRGTMVAPSIYHQLWSRGVAQQRFKQGTTWGVSLTRTF